MQTIHVLPESVINQIAAGEVIERPSNVLKELIENSLDARASQVDIFLIKGGLSEIKVIDNGKGMSREDLLLSIIRHATSKLKKAEDLEAIDTFGFRGEALSSICSVAEVEIKTKYLDDSSGASLTIQNGILHDGPNPVSCPQGTQITVKNIFHKIPGRQKFMRSEATELSHCQKIVKELAIGNPNVRFSLRHDKRLLATFPSQPRTVRLQDCLKLPDEPLSWTFNREEAKLEFVISSPTARLPRTDFLFFLNGRIVRHRPFLAAIRSAWQESMGQQAELVGACFLNLRRDWVDVNVHPQKWEVRCLNQESIYHWIYSSLKHKLSQFSSVDETSTSAARATDSSTNRYSPPPKRFGTNSDVSFSSRFIFEEADDGLWVAPRALTRLKALFRQVTNLSNHSCFTAFPLAVPFIFRLMSFERAQGFSESFKQISRPLGFQYENFGDGDLAFSTRPSFLKEEALHHFLTDLVDWALTAVMGSQQTPSFTQTLWWITNWLAKYPESSEFDWIISTQQEAEELQHIKDKEKDVMFIPYQSFKNIPVVQT